MKAKALLLKDLVGRRVRLLRHVRTRGGDVFVAGRTMVVLSTWRGTFELKALRGTSSVRGLSRASFEVLA